MRDDEIAELFRAAPEDLPIAERYLRNPTTPASNYWATEGGVANMRALGGWRLQLARILARIT